MPSNMKPSGSSASHLLVPAVEVPVPWFWSSPPSPRSGIWICHRGGCTADAPGLNQFSCWRFLLILTGQLLGRRLATRMWTLPTFSSAGFRWAFHRQLGGLHVLRNLSGSAVADTSAIARHDPDHGQEGLRARLLGRCNDRLGIQGVVVPPSHNLVLYSIVELPLSAASRRQALSCRHHPGICCWHLRSSRHHQHQAQLPKGDPVERRKIP